VLVAENGFLGIDGVSPKFSVHPNGPKPDDYYQITWTWHNGRGTWPSGGPERFKALNVKLKDWRTAGEHVLVCPNRSFGVGEQVMREDWADRTAARLEKLTKRRIVIRRHPGNSEPVRPLSADLENAWACVVWSSGVAVHSLLAGIPTYIEAPYQIVKGASATGPVDAPQVVDRLPHFERMAFAQWTVSEIGEGAPFRHLFTSYGQYDRGVSATG
jgi:hypothetical protein